MRICYVDESGCTGVLPNAHSPIQPAFIVAGVAFDQAQLSSVTFDFLNIKHPRVARTPPLFLDWVLAEIKGSNLRRALRSGGRNRRRHALVFLDHFLRFLASHDAKIMGRVLVKGIGTPIHGRAVYTSAIQTIFSTFHDYLDGIRDQGLIVIDSRRKDQNVNVAHSLFTQKFQAGGDPHFRVLEMPTFGHSENHVGIQIADILCSAFLFPMAVHAYCSGHVHNVHVHPAYEALRRQFGLRLRALQHRYRGAERRWRGGIVVCDSLTKRSGASLFV
jgi:hypothetical protein